MKQVFAIILSLTFFMQNFAYSMSFGAVAHSCHHHQVEKENTSKKHACCKAKKERKTKKHSEEHKQDSTKDCCNGNPFFCCCFSFVAVLNEEIVFEFLPQLTHQPTYEYLEPTSNFTSDIFQPPIS